MTDPPPNPQRKAFERGIRDGRSSSGRKPPQDKSLKRQYNDGYLVGSARRQLALLRKARQTAE
jgi:hypothetical protein